MIEFIFTLMLAAIVGALSYSVGVDDGRKSMHRGDAVCQNLIDGEVRCVVKGEIKP